MSKKKRAQFTFDYQSIQRQVRNGLHYIWRQTVVFNLVMIVIIGFLFWLLLSRAFIGLFNCNYIITQRLGLDNVVCSGATIPGSGSITSLFGSNSDIGIPGLAGAVDGPLEGLRRLLLWLIFIFFMVFSGLLTYLINNLKKVIKLITFDKREWENLLAVMRIFFTILVLLTGALFLYALF